MPDDLNATIPLDTTPEPVMADAPADRIPTAEPLDGAVIETNEPEPVVPDATPEPVEPPYVAELKRGLEDARRELETLKGTPKADAPVTASEPTPEQWDNIEKGFGFTVQEHKNEDGSISKSLNVNPRLLIKTMFSQLDVMAANLRKEFDGRLHENTADSRMDRAYFDMEKRTANPLTDIRQHAPEIKKFLQDFYNGQPQKWSDPKILEAAYWHSVGVKARAKAANPTKTDIKVIHPNAPRPVAKTSNAAPITAQERMMMRGMVNPRTGKQITDAEWIASRGK